MRFPPRRADWRLGRWTAKHAVAACLHLAPDARTLAQIELRPAPSGAPQVFLRDTWAPVTISLSHRAGRAICAIAHSAGDLGCDLELIEPHSDAFIADYFATEEQALVSHAAPDDRPWLLALLWSAKESALKALRAGLTLDTRTVVVTPIGAPRNGGGAVGGHNGCDPAGDAVDQPDAVQRWRPLRVRHLNDRIFPGWWQRSGSLMRTMVAAPPPARPRLLNGPRRAESIASVVGSEQFQAA
jgi:4'-phosphopantetheinyl transferase